MTEEEFFVTTMPDSRPADYYLGYSEGAVFLDFDNVNDGRVCLKRISFDGHGCCELPENAIPMNVEDSSLFKRIIKDDELDQDRLSRIIKDTIARNQAFLWKDSLEVYSLI